MASIDSLYKVENERVLIEMNLSSVLQLFNSLDPAPFHEKELDKYAEEYIIDAVKDFPPKTRFKIVIYLPDRDINTKVSVEIAKAIRSHFEYRSHMERRKFRERLIYGEFALVVGLTFLAIATIASMAIDTYAGQHPAAHLVSTALEVTGWVAMWEPVTVFLFQLWPIRKQRKLYDKISQMEIDILPYRKFSPKAPELHIQPEIRSSGILKSFRKY
ncbi:hypothetical protein [Methanocella arvoryzae]|uniref:Uncharacterized protein n=1 Tax=Methanocella arvoryzae (strain DSM 22066 / NBRC 105507 / MRE50) TaxID=351160 RepID=Q0W0E5_METAR|nr:hypothetical protein [Methanocella arvoryzae]CAJ38148.1 conserved hypothetical protein [Methanocella arvoryzae MRE50]